MAEQDFSDLDALLRETLADAAARKPPLERLKDQLQQRARFESERNYIRSEENGGTKIGSRGCLWCGGRHLTRDCEVP
jgi:hypothetical protein